MRKLFYTVFVTSLIMPFFSAHAVLLGLPVECSPGVNCFVQNYVDHDSGPGWKDYRCGHLSYDGHDGTDFRIPSLVEMETGVNVLAAADGVVKSTRDAMKDINIKNIDRAQIKDRECGNGVMLEHKEGWSTQYCHLKQGSIAVKPGDEVKAGDVLGQIGLSGMTEFPHLHFTLRHEEKEIDPFTGKGIQEACGQSGFSKWEPEAEKALAYKPPGLLGAGFTAEIPTQESVMAGKNREAVLTAGEPLIFWAQVYGPREGDVIRMTLSKGEGEHGEVVAKHEQKLPKSKADFMQYIGKKTPEAGEYFGVFTLTRTTEKDGPQVLVKYEGHVSVE